jgi:hypothetical protein
LTERVAQVGAILILWKPENRDKLPFFMGSNACVTVVPSYAAMSLKSSPRQAAAPPDGRARGYARVNGHIVVDGHHDVRASGRHSGCYRVAITNRFHNSNTPRNLYRALPQTIPRLSCRSTSPFEDRRRRE